MDLETFNSFAMYVGLAVGYTAAYRGLVALIGRAAGRAIEALSKPKGFAHGGFRHA